MIKVLIVDDSILIRKILTDILSSDNTIEVVGTAENGKDALKKIPLLNPDVITLDVEMPIMDGIATLKTIVKEYRIPVLMLSSLTVEGANLTFKALEIGAIDFVRKPKNIFTISGEKEKANLINKVKIVSESNIVDSPVEYESISGVKKENYMQKNILFNKRIESIIAIGSSTGGPRALQKIIPKLPSNINSTILIVQHMPAGFTKSLAERLNNISNVIVKEGESGEKLKKGYCYIAPGNYHMTVENVNDGQTIVLDQSPPIHGLRPSVDIMMESLAKLNNINKIGVILTGMGSDGTKGISAISNSGGFTIAQNKETSVVYGMPKTAIATGNIDKILPLQDIADEIIKMEV